MPSPRTARIRVLLVDDHPILREGLAAILGSEHDMLVVSEAGSGEDALEQFPNCRPDVTLMDLRLPGMQGSEAIGAICAAHPDAKVLVLSSYAGDEDIHRALQAGAYGYLLKDMLRKELIDAVRAVHAGNMYLPDAVRERLSERLLHEPLTPRETEIVALIAQGYSNREISQEIGASEGTVRIHVSHILAKLGVTDRTQAALQAIKRGIVPLA
ncbi:MAG: response regulator transcription factor [Bryobacterales bacterium]|jgi:DNA-binding NarL/FixJ family response regulator|nr:response regulator transcription factor [Bryobacterales bacterium]